MGQMPDLLIVEQLRLALSQAYSLMQWWASVSFGLLAVAHFGKDQLNRVFVVILSLLYAAFTLYTLVNIGSFFREFGGYRADLRVIAETGEISAGALAWITPTRMGALLIPSFAICTLGIFFGVLFYLVYSYRRERRSMDGNTG